MARWFGLEGERLSAAFWLVFGQGKSFGDALADVDEAPHVLIRTWARNGSRSWKGFERLIERTLSEPPPPGGGGRER